MKVMNLTHVIHEFSFGPFFPAISQPLDMSLETTEERRSSYVHALTSSLRLILLFPPHRANNLH